MHLLNVFSRDAFAFLFWCWLSCRRSFDRSRLAFEYAKLPEFVCEIYFEAAAMNVKPPIPQLGEEDLCYVHWNVMELTCILRYKHHFISEVGEKVASVLKVDTIDARWSFRVAPGHESREVIKNGGHQRPHFWFRDNLNAPST
ncbi:hypothetical protein GCM10007920_38670 [Ciceribacter naphthalenivorans]|uniref:Uncharacterized protein n=2 Tax=Alphaproteobacteria TaxID=28211 RepID=A0A512HE91_9HYPH|nr:hypothetical protein RNA01_07070 [Ciceribacter naphthalenivorans]GLR24073.1 hypothetical protein GCM10007920_38670 [Ciceribacter naphthalenivorans]GLT06929.1 hypothetical protein GCM10007926_38670 [Sphingomonas psychrolutea]